MTHTTYSKAATTTSSTIFHGMVGGTTSIISTSFSVSHILGEASHLICRAGFIQYVYILSK